MILSSNPRPLQLWKTLSLEVADSGLAQVDNTWNMEKVCSPYSRVYFIPEGSGTLTLRGREIALQEGYVYLIPAGLLYNYRCDSHMEQLYFHVNIIQVNGMDLFFGCEEVYERKVSGQYLEKVLALYRSQRMGDSFCLQGILWEELGFFTRMAGVQETRTRIYSEMVEQFFCSHKIRSALEIISAAWPIGCMFRKARFPKNSGRKRVCIREAIWNSWLSRRPAAFSCRRTEALRR